MFSFFIKTLALILIFSHLPYIFFSGFQAFVVYKNQNSNFENITILGAGVLNNGTPSKILKFRLDKGLEVFEEKDSLKYIMLSGDGRTDNYNETKTMKNYLISQNFEEDKILVDSLGFRTIESCFNLKNKYDINETYLVSQDFHLPRSVFLCQMFGVETQPIVAENTSPSSSLKGYFREIPATWLALYEVYRRI